MLLAQIKKKQLNDFCQKEATCLGCKYKSLLSLRPEPDIIFNQLSSKCMTDHLVSGWPLGEKRISGGEIFWKYFLSPLIIKKSLLWFELRKIVEPAFENLRKKTIMNPASGLCLIF